MLLCARHLQEIPNIYVWQVSPYLDAFVAIYVHFCVFLAFYNLRLVSLCFRFYVRYKKVFNFFNKGNLLFKDLKCSFVNEKP
jgi:hypothetical protein